MNTTMKQLDDLTIIKGIGPTRQEWLRKSFHIHTYDDLAALSPDEIEVQLKAVGRIAARREVEAWLAQAQLLATGTTVNVPRESNQWDAIASYVVEIQTRLGETPEKKTQEYRTAVHHMEADVGKAWAGIQTDELCAWMMAQVGENEAKGPAAERIVESKPVVDTHLQVVISHIGLFQPPNITPQILASEISQPLQGIINGDQPFALEVAFELATQEATDGSTQEIRSTTQFHGYNLTTGANIYLGDTKDVVPMGSTSAWVVRLSNISLPPGLYRVRIVVILQSRPPRIDYIEIPLLQVL